MKMAIVRTISKVSDDAVLELIVDDVLKKTMSAVVFFKDNIEKKIVESDNSKIKWQAMLALLNN
jgi:hypothetical protein